MLAAAACLVAGCGGGGTRGAFSGDRTAPALTITSPATGASMADSVFWANSFQITLKYEDASEMDMASLAVTMKMDNGASQSINQYFSKQDSTTIISANISQFTHTLFDIQSNDQTRTITVTASIKDAKGNQSTSPTATITITPVAQPPAGPPGD